MNRKEHLDDGKSVYPVVSDKQMSRVRDALEEVTSLVDSLRLGCEIAYRREPTQAEGDAYEFRYDQSMGASHGTAECFVPMGSHHGWRCTCGAWVWGGPTICQRCVDREAVKISTERIHSVRALLEASGCDCDCEHHHSEHDAECERCLACRVAHALEHT